MDFVETGKIFHFVKAILLAFAVALGLLLVFCLLAWRSPHPMEHLTLYGSLSMLLCGFTAGFMGARHTQSPLFCGLLCGVIQLLIVLCGSLCFGAAQTTWLQRGILCGADLLAALAGAWLCSAKKDGKKRVSPKKLRKQFAKKYQA